MEQELQSTQTPAPVKKSKKGIIITIIVAIILLILAVAGTWYVMDQKSKMSESEQKAPKKETIEVKKEEEKPPTGFKSIVLNGVTVVYPTEWSTPEKKVTQENITNDPGMEFQGEYANFSEWKETLIVNNSDSYAKSTYANNILTALKNTYESRAVDLEGVYTTQGILPPTNAGVSKYAIRYVESQNSKWRGYWFVGTISQQMSATPSFNAFLYNKDLGKVFTVRHTIQTTKSNELTDKITTSYQQGQTEQTKLANDIMIYLQGIYANDAEIKKTVDSVDLVICRFVQ